MKRIIVLFMTGLIVMSMLSSCAEKNTANETTVMSTTGDIIETKDETTENIDISDDTEITTSEDKASQPTEEATAEADIVTAVGSTTENQDKEFTFYFSTTDINGNKISSDDFKDCKLVMLNFWESWCGPCVGEMPELEKLYNAYKDKGFVIIGAYTTQNDEDNVNGIIKDTGVTYPIICATNEMYQFMSDYVPTTVLLDGYGNVLNSEQIIGAKSYDEWESIISTYLN